MIQLPNTGFPLGTIVVAAAMQPRFYEFSTSMERLKVPEGTRWLTCRGCDITHNFNEGVQKSTGEWIWFMGDDHGFDENILLNLLALGKDIVVPPTPCKTFPFLPCIMHGSGSLDVWNGSMPLYTWEELSVPGLLMLPVGDFIGQAGMLVKKSVLNGWEYPWFKAGQQDPGRLQEDMTFCRELQQRGFTIWVDRDQLIAHYYVMGITAKRHDGQYVPALLNNAEVLLLPDAVAIRTEDGQTKLRRQMTLEDTNPNPPPKSRVPTWLEGVDDA